MKPSTPLLLWCALLAPVAGCKRGEAATSEDRPASSSGALPTREPPAMAQAKHGDFTLPEGPIVGAIGGQVNILAEPSVGARRLGYIRLGGVLRRDPDPVGKSGCPGGWYKVQPRGYICIDENATLDRDNAILKAAAIVRPRLDEAMPYRYGFVRAVLPLYLRVPTRDEQFKSEMSLKEHLAKWDAQKDELNKVALGAYDVPVDERGVGLLGKKLGDVPAPSTSQGQGVLFGALNEQDAIPWWLEGGRKIPNLADFKVPPYAVFADRARRHTGLSFVGSFPTGEESLQRRFAITTDMRLAPVSKVKPDTGSPWHGLELVDPAKSPPLPFAWVRTSEAHAYRMVDGKPRDKGPLDKRSVVLLTGRKVPGPDGFYWEMKNGLFLRASQAAVVRLPDEWPDAAKKNAKWIEVSIENQTITLWQGQKPVFATLVSTGQDGMGDPKKTKSTVRGSFAVQSKHVTATMDSNEGSGSTLRKPSSGGDDGEGKGKGKGKKSDDKYAAAVSQTAAKRAADPEYGVTKRRGEGTFWLRDVPYVQYFEGSYALHVAYWHDVFGIARSHGCINLAPLDGRFINSWTDPPIPDGWHGVVAGPEAPGTTVIVHELTVMPHLPLKAMFQRAGAQLRPARDDDSVHFLSILEQVFSEYPGCVLVLDEEPEMQHPATAFTAQGGQISALERGGHVVGMAAYRPDAHEPGLIEMKKIYLLPSARGLGLGRALVTWVEHEALARRARAVHLWSDTRFTTAHRLYEKMGYRRLPETRDLHDASHTTEFHYRKELGES